MAFNSNAPLKKKNAEFPPFPKRGQIKARIFQSLINAAVSAVKGHLAGGGLNGKNAKFRRIPKRGRIKDRIFQSLINPFCFSSEVVSSESSPAEDKKAAVYLPTMIRRRKKC